MNSLIEKYNLSLDGLTDITVNLQESNSQKIVFYNIADNKKSEELFFERLEGKDVGLLIVNKEVECANVIALKVVDLKDYESLQVEMCKILYPNTNKIKILAVTGTNGKSTVVHLCQQILNYNNIKAISIGTVGIYENNIFLGAGSGTTTPSYVDLQRFMNEFNEHDVVCIEVSSHALEQRRLYDLEFDSIGWTNISQDHLDYHSTMEEYFLAKLKIIKNSKIPLVIAPDEYELESLLNVREVNYNISSKISSIELDDSFQLEYNIKNISLALSLCEIIESKNLMIPKGICAPKGRFSTQKLGHNVFVVDYAHTPDALENVLKETQASFPEHKLISIFGCGGDRDKLKRPLMLDAAMKYSSQIVVTTDNPRSEEPDTIVSDILAGRDFESSEVEVILDRKIAIEEFVKNYEQKTIVVVAGKGHEEYQDIKGKKYFFSDIEVIENAIGILKNEIK